MAQKAQKTLAARNTQILKNTHMTTLIIQLTFLLFRLFLTKRSLLAWILLSLPALLIEFWFERIGRPTYVSEGSARELKRAGEDLEAKGLTEWMWDVVYWTWGCLGFVAVLGDWVWWGYIVVPLYSLWLAYTTFTGARQGLAGITGGNSAAGSGADPAGQSKRQAKLEKRGGQKVQYR